VHSEISVVWWFIGGMEISSSGTTTEANLLPLEDLDEGA
jgi:hypothetical protein